MGLEFLLQFGGSNVGLLSSAGHHPLLTSDDLINVPLHEDDFVAMLLREIRKECRNDLDSSPPSPGNPFRIPGFEILHGLEFVVTLWVVLVGLSLVIGHRWDPARLQHLHHHRGPRSGEPRDDGDNPRGPFTEHAVLDALHEVL
jgi:hypothetical protein